SLRKAPFARRAGSPQDAGGASRAAQPARSHPGSRRFQLRRRLQRDARSVSCRRWSRRHIRGKRRERLRRARRAAPRAEAPRAGGREDGPLRRHRPVPLEKLQPHHRKGGSRGPYPRPRASHPAAAHEPAGPSAFRDRTHAPRRARHGRLSFTPFMTAQRIHLVFKTHLDLGFTDHAEKVRRLYHERFIPQAIATGEHFHAECPDNPKFIWTTGAWLIWDHLETRSREQAARLERAVEKGIIRWHGLPFTTHSELMSPALFRAGLSFSAELDRRFGRNTIAAKMTDVPGHTRGIVTLMAEAGLKFLHMGVNS